MQNMKFYPDNNLKLNKKQLKKPEIILIKIKPKYQLQQKYLQKVIYFIYILYKFNELKMFIGREKIEKCPFLKALAQREEDVLNGKLLTIIFIRMEGANSEISGYIDYAHRLKTENFKIYFEG